MFGAVSTREDPMSQLQWDQEAATTQYMMSLEETRDLDIYLILVAWIWTQALCRQCQGSLLSVCWTGVLGHLTVAHLGVAAFAVHNRDLQSTPYPCSQTKSKLMFDQNILAKYSRSGENVTKKQKKGYLNLAEGKRASQY